MFHDRGIENKITRLHERVLRLVYRDDNSTFNELLRKDGFVTIHHRNVQLLAIELFKHNKGLSPQIMNHLFEDKDYTGPNLRSQTEYQLPKINSVLYGENSLRYLGPKIWDIIPRELKSLESLGKFKSAIKTWMPLKCPCRLYKDYIQGIGFVNVA